MTAPVGSIVNVTYDPDPGVKIVRGDVMRTPSGRLYRVFWVFKAKRTKYPGRLTLQMQVIDAMPTGKRESFIVTDDLIDAPCCSAWPTSPTPDLPDRARSA